VRAGILASALDEFLAARVPIQLGGLHDPFTPREERDRVTYRLLEILSRYEHPTVISTKGKLAVGEEYLSLLQQMNVFVRFSAAGVSELLRPQVDRRCDTFPQTLNKIATLSSRGVATGLRVQPVIPGFEEDALEMTREAAAAGAKQVSFEYLKVPVESMASEIPALSAVVGSDILGSMRERGLRMVGWDYMLTSDAKRAFVGRAEAGFRRKSESSLPGGGRAFRRGRHGLRSLE
jgi:DNA repair photolyase